MGVVNVTPDSFSDGGAWFTPQDAVAHGRALVAAGADLLDVGVESTRPGAQRPSAVTCVSRQGRAEAARLRDQVLNCSAASRA